MALTLDTVTNTLDSRHARHFAEALETLAILETKDALPLLDFIKKRNIGKSIDINRNAYTLVHINLSRNAFWRSRSLSVYFKTKKINHSYFRPLV